MIKKLLIWLLAATMLLTLAACTDEQPEPTQTGLQETTFDGITVTVVEARRDAQETVLTVRWENKTQFDAMYGEMFGLQRLEGDQWVPCEMKENTGFITIGYLLKAGETVTKGYQLEWAFGELKSGTYRFVTSCHVTVETENKECKLSSEFTLSDDEPQSNLSDTTEIFDAPPKLQLIHSDGNTELPMGTYTWSYDQNDGTWSHTCADGIHPLQLEDQLKPICPGNPQVFFEFEDWPDDYIVRCWPDSAFGETDAQSNAVRIWNNSMELRRGGYIYEVTATWNDDGGPYYGQVTYYFYAAPAMPYDVMPIQTKGIIKLYIAGEVLSADGEKSGILNQILSNLSFTAGQEEVRPDFAAETLDGTLYEISVARGLVRCDRGLAKLAPDQIQQLSLILRWAEEETKAR